APLRRIGELVHLRRVLASDELRERVALASAERGIRAGLELLEALPLPANGGARLAYRWHVVQFVIAFTWFSRAIASPTSRCVAGGSWSSGFQPIVNAFSGGRRNAAG